MTYTDIIHNTQEANLVVSKVSDGDNIAVIGLNNRKEKEIRLYGINALETRNGRELREDKEKTRIVGEKFRFMGTNLKNLFLDSVLQEP